MAGVCLCGLELLWVLLKSDVLENDFCRELNISFLFSHFNFSVISIFQSFPNLFSSLFPSDILKDLISSKIYSLFAFTHFKYPQNSERDDSRERTSTREERKRSRRDGDRERGRDRDRDRDRERDRNRDKDRYSIFLLKY